MKKVKNLKEVIKDIEKLPEIKKLPREVRKTFEEYLKSVGKIPFPIVTLKENDWIIANTPLIDVSAQGKTEKEAVDNLIAMIDDYMSDPYTKKPKVETIINMEVGVKTIPIKLPISKLCQKPQRAVSNG